MSRMDSQSPRISGRCIGFVDNESGSFYYECSYMRARVDPMVHTLFFQQTYTLNSHFANTHSVLIVVGGPTYGDRRDP